MSTAYVNGRFVPFAEAALPLDDAGVFWGAIVTDRLRTFNGRPFCLSDHLVRFRQSCDLARVPLPAADEELTVVANELVARDSAGFDLSLVFLATPGRARPDPTLIVHSLPIPIDRVRTLHSGGANLFPHPAIIGVDSRIKHRNRLPWWIATRTVQDSDADAEPLFTDPVTGAVLETASASLVAVFGDTLTVPPIDTILPSISLRTTLELAAGLGLLKDVRPFTVADLGEATEVFITNSTVCIAPVARIGAHSFPTDGPVLTRLQAEWSRLVGVEIGRPAS